MLFLRACEAVSISIVAHADIAHPVDPVRSAAAAPAPSFYLSKFE